MGAYTVGEIRVNTAVPIKMIQNLYFENKGNAHVNLVLEAFIFEDDVEKALFHVDDHTSLSVWAEETLLFAGMVMRVQVTQEGNGYKLFLWASSATVQMDHKKRLRTFQNIHSTYQDVIGMVLRDTEGAKLNFCAEDREIGTPLYQIEETDWEFIKRIASHLETAVVPGGLSDIPEIYIGNPRGMVHDIESPEILSECVEDAKGTCGICRRIKTYKNMSVGDRVSLRKAIYTITEKKCFLEKGLLCFKYKLVEKKAFSCKRYGNPNAAGRLFSARVIGVEKEQIKVKFDIDESQGLPDAYWYPWRPEVGNLMYCMPEKGEKVYIHLGNCAEEQAWAVCGIHENGTGNPEMKVSDRYFTTSAKKRMFFLPDQMGFQDLEKMDPLEILLSDDLGIHLTSSKKMSVSAKDTIGFKGDNVFFQAPKEVSLIRKDSVFPSVINMCNGFDSVGATNEVAMDGMENAFFPGPHEDYPKAKAEYSIADIGKELIASTPCRDLESNMEKQIRGVMVDSLGE